MVSEASVFQKCTTKEPLNHLTLSLLAVTFVVV